jgi:hypothetical protein
MVSNDFKSLKSSMEQMQAEQNQPLECVGRKLALHLERLREEQAILHFETAEKTLGPGHLVSFDLGRNVSSILRQL